MSETVAFTRPSLASDDVILISGLRNGHIPYLYILENKMYCSKVVPVHCGQGKGPEMGGQLQRLMAAISTWKFSRYSGYMCWIYEFYVSY